MRWLGSLCAGALVLSIASGVQAFCGFYIKQDDERVTSRASRVVLLRDGTTTVLSMQNTYEGPPEDFALIVPVPTSITADDVRTLEPEVFDRIDQLTSPRLVEYWEQAPWCADGNIGYGSLGAMGYGMGGGGGMVRIEAAFAVGEYDVVVLGATESSGLEAWLRQEGYHLPDGASEALRPYIEQGYRFFAARVNAQRVRFEDGHALLSPLRIRYESPQLALPVRLGMLSSPGTQDLVVYVVSRDGRYEVANRPNVLVPTNLEVRRGVRGQFGAFYDALLGRVWEHHPGSVITEYAWEATSCDPCPGPTMSAEDITTIGGDVASGAVEQVSQGVGMATGPVVQVSGPPLGTVLPSRLVAERHAAMQQCVREPFSFHARLSIVEGHMVDARVEPEGEVGRCLESALLGGARTALEGRIPSVVRVSMAIDRRATWAQTSARGFTVTRLRYRYGDGSPASDLVFRRARPIQGGNGEPDERGRFETSVGRATTNQFQARYAILHRRAVRGIEGCRNVEPGGWGGPPAGVERRTGTARALGALRGRGAPIPLEQLLRTPVPSIHLRPRAPRRTTSARSLGLMPIFAFGAILVRRRRRRVSREGSGSR